MGLKEPGLRGSLRNVSVGIDAIPDEAVLYIPMDEGSGTTAADSVGSNDADIQGPTWTSDSDLEGGFGLEYDSATDRSVLSTLPIMDGSSNFCVGITVRKTANQSGSDIGDHETFWAHTTTDSDDRMACGLADEDIYFEFASSTVEIGDTQPDAPYLSRVFVRFFDDVSAELYVDKSEITGTPSDRSGSNDPGHVIGNQPDRDRGMRNGILSGYTIYDGIVSPETDFDFSAVTD